MSLTAEQRAVGALGRELARKRAELRATGRLSQARDEETFAALIPDARKEVERLYRQGARLSFETIEQKKQAARNLQRAEREVAGVRRLLDAAKAVDGWLVRNSSVQTRLKDGRHSLTSFKLDRHLQDLLLAVADVGSSQVKVTIDPERLQQIREELTGGQMAWAEYTFKRLDSDLTMAIHDAWSVLEADLPLPPPALPRLLAPWEAAQSSTSPWWQAPEPPAFTVEYPIGSVLSDLGRTVRTQLTSVVMLASLAGLASFRGSAWMGLLVLVMLPVGWFVVQRDRQKKVEDLAEKGLKKTSSELQQWVDSRLNRTEGRIRDHAVYQLQVPIRAALKDWFRREVIPRQARAEEKQAAAKRAVREAEEARRSFERDWKMGDIERLRALLRPAEEEG